MMGGVGGEKREEEMGMLFYPPGAPTDQVSTEDMGSPDMNM